MKLLDTAGIAELFSCSREHATDKLTKRAGFPAPVIDLSRKMRKWDQAEVIAWAQAHRRSRDAMSSADSR